MFEKSNLTPAKGRSVAFGSHLSVILKTLCPNAAPLQEVEDTSQTSSEMDVQPGVRAFDSYLTTL
jgi:hypothetical protein